MKNKLTFVIILISLISCINKPRVVEKIEFNNEYKFRSEIELKVKTDTVVWKHQLAAADFALIGDYKNALKYWDLAFKGRARTYSKKQTDSIRSKYKTVSATDYIIQQAKINKVVIINEAHHISLHRVFTKSLLQRLFDNGYKNLGLEALGNGKYLDSLLNERKYPIQETGYYTKDPRFGNLIREALSIGYYVFAYDNITNRNGKLREIAQAKNIQKVIEERQGEKFLIYCGFDHVLEGIYPRWGKTMAGRLNEYTGINPFTINQTLYSERSNPEFNHPFSKVFNVKQASVLLDSENKPLRYEKRKNWTDLVILNPNTQYIDNRPNWLFNYPNKNVKIDLKDIGISFPAMVFAFKKGEDINKAVPIDIYETEKRKNNPHLALPNGNYEIVIVNRNREARKFELVVQ